MNGQQEETVTGKLILPGNNKKPKLFRYDNKMETNFNNKQLDPKLKEKVDRLRTDRNQTELDVEFDLGSGNPRNIRLAAASAGGEPPLSPEPERKSPKRKSPPGPRKGSFHNPYNFVPAPPRKTDDDQLGDCSPDGHHCLFGDRYSGSVGVQLTTATPLLIPDAASAETDGIGHTKFPVRLGPDGRPYLAPTAVKGMLSAAYEAVTNSRLRIFEKHDRRLAFRQPAGEGLSLVPARILPGAELELLLGSTPDIPQRNNRSGRWQIPGQTMYAAWLRMYGRHACSWGTLATHGRSVWAYITRWQHSNPNFDFWNVAALADGDGPMPTHTPHDDRTPWHNGAPHLAPSGHWVQGFVCITNQNIDRKHDERVFFIEDNHPLASQKRIQLPSANGVCPVLKAWKDLIRSYQDAHDERSVWRRAAADGNRGHAQPWDFIGRDPGKTAWSRHVYLDGKGGREDAAQLNQNGLCYARVHRSGTRLEVEAIYPVMISRELFPSSPEALLDLSLRPASQLKQLSPADRVFGWVAPNAEQSRATSSDTVVAFRGQLRVGPVTCQSEDAVEDFRDNPVPLAILSSPKPSQASFYLEQQGQPVQQKNDGYDVSRGQSLRGRKVYPHHQIASGEQYWNQDTDGGDRDREYRRAEGTRDEQNRSMKEWVKIGTTFTFRLHVSNLSQVELGALLWLLNLEGGHFHRLGGGKPLGFGSVQLAILQNDNGQPDCDLRTGADWRNTWLTLEETAAPDQRQLIDSAVSAYEQAVEHAYGDGKPFPEVSFIRAFLAAARGLDDSPVHYPRMAAQPDPDGENFKWFAAAEKNGGCPLPTLEDGGLLPYGNEIK